MSYNLIGELQEITILEERSDHYIVESDFQGKGMLLKNKENP